MTRFTDRVRSLGGLAIVCHPWVPIPGTKWDFGYDYAGMDAIELWNGPWTLDDNHCVEHWHSLLVAGQFIPGVGSSDSHGVNQPVGLAQTIVRAPALSAPAVIAAVKAGHSWLAESSAVGLTFTASVGDRSASCGDRLAVGPETVVDVVLDVTGVPGAWPRSSARPARWPARSVTGTVPCVSRRRCPPDWHRSCGRRYAASTAPRCSTRSRASPDWRWWH